jgi:MraZ protein
MLIGQQVAKVGPKNRLSVPKKFREELGQNLVLSYGYEGCLILLSKKKWQELVKEAIAGPLTSAKIRKEARFLLSQAEEVELDEQGRFVLPEHLKDYAQIKADVCFIGLLRWVEVWASEAWEKVRQKMKKGGLKPA